jgi:hypothetical protein
MAVIPAQNATGNWIKTVQRLPVRIELDPAELRKHPVARRAVDGSRDRCFSVDEGTMSETASYPRALALPRRGSLAAGLVLALANFMVILDLTIANVSIPHVAGSLGHHA